MGERHRWARLILIAATALCAACAPSAAAPHTAERTTAAPADSWTSVDPITSSSTPESPELSTLLMAAKVLTAEPPERADYDRKCTPGHACVFGPSWTDDSQAPDSHDGCDTRNNVLAEQLSHVVYKRPSRPCVVISGVLDPDPYTGRVVQFRKSDASAVQVDHLYPLARAWQFGAWHWSQDKRTTFANDTALNLMAVDGETNRAKSSSGLADWMPPNKQFQCTYAIKYLTVANHYDLGITIADRSAAFKACDDAGTPPQ